MTDFVMGDTAVPELASVRVDEATGVIDRAAFLGPAGERIFAVASLPPGDVRGNVVIAPSLLTDRIRLYRGEVLAARRLAALGFAVLRFDYRGFGHSDGETGVTDAERMALDVDLAVRELETLSGTHDLTLVGSRFGSVLIANRLEPVRRAVLWDPVLSGRDYFKTAFRAAMIGRLQRTGSDSTPTAQLAGTGQATVLGYTVSRELVESTNGLTLAPGDSLAGADVLWIESGAELSKAQTAAAEQLRDNGARLDLRLLPNADPGWFVGVRPFESGAALDTLVGWISGEDR